jgi:hypothetical protein
MSDFWQLADAGKILTENILVTFSSVFKVFYGLTSF